MRPNSIIWFERLILATLFLGLIQSYLGWDEAVAVAAEASANPGAFILTIQIFVFALIAALTLLISRRRSKIALWVSIALFVLGLPAFLGLVASGLIAGIGLIAVVQTIGQLIAYCLLFTPASRRWMSRDEQPEQVFS